QKRPPVAEADDLRGDALAVATDGDLAQLADLGLQAGRLDDEADQVRDAAAPAVEVGARERREALVEGGLRHRSCLPRASRARGPARARAARRSARRSRPPKSARRSR